MVNTGYFMVITGSHDTDCRPPNRGHLNMHVAQHMQYAQMLRESKKSAFVALIHLKIPNLLDAVNSA